MSSARRASWRRCDSMTTLPQPERRDFAGVQSNYQGQGLKLAKQFAPVGA